MCKFCDSLKWRTYQIPYRTCSADDNRCEYASPDIWDDGEEQYYMGCDCKDCHGCMEKNLNFSIRTYGNLVGVDFTHRIRELIIEPSSEMFRINFCPWCGKSLGNENIPFEKCGIVSG